MIMLMHITKTTSSGCADGGTPTAAAGWVSDGSAFYISDKQELADRWLPLFFPPQSKYTSFIRKLYRWRFKTVSLPHEMRPAGVRPGSDVVYYHHENFHRDKKSLLLGMRCFSGTSANQEPPSEMPSSFEVATGLARPASATATSDSGASLSFALPPCVPSPPQENIRRSLLSQQQDQEEGGSGISRQELLQLLSRQTSDQQQILRLLAQSQNAQSLHASQTTNRPPTLVPPDTSTGTSSSSSDSGMGLRLPLDLSSLRSADPFAAAADRSRAEEQQLLRLLGISRMNQGQQ